MRATTIEEILGDFSPKPSEVGLSATTGGKPVTIWLPADAKVRFDQLQERSGRKFGKKVREAVLALIEIAEARAG